MKHAVLLAALLAFTPLAEAQDTLHERVMALYSFSPHTLNKDQLNAKSGELDRFWAEVKRDGPAALDDLRRELARPDAPPFFSFDGAKLLMSLSKTKEDKQLALNAIVRTDLRDLQLTGYFLTIHSLAVQELDTTEAAFKILGSPNFQAFIPQHALTLNQEMCLIYMLLPTKEVFYLDKVQRRLFSEKDLTAQKSLLDLLAFTVTKSDDEAIARFAADPEQPEESRKHAMEIVGATRKMMSASIVYGSLSSYDTLKGEQRKLLARVSDEALYDWESLRVKIRRKGAQ